jgi:hypothetical protein
MKNCVFTICAKNYIGLAIILEKSFKEHNPDSDFLIFVVDEFEEKPDSLPSNVYISREVLKIDDALWVEMSFKYDITEFCTSIKPKCFEFLMDNTRYENFIYLDPDIYIYNSFAPVFKQLETHSIVLTPHVLNFNYAHVSVDDLLQAGVFNLGFIAVRKDEIAKQMLSWWGNQLKNKCFDEYREGLFTDQKWINLIPVFFNREDICISRHKGLNVAPWNFHEREIVTENDVLKVRYREDISSSFDELIFIHYSGYNYFALKEDGKIIQKYATRQFEYKDVIEVLNRYNQALCEQKDIFDSYIHYNYTYNSFDNKMPILKIHRRIYRSLLLKGEKFPNPFFSTNDSFYSKLKKHGLINPKISTKSVSSSQVLNKYGIELQIFNYLMKIVYRILGIQKYIYILQLFSRYRFESQIHLIDKKYNANNIL